MRLGQLARKYDVSLQQIISYLNKIDPAHESLHHNSKLDEQIELMVVDHFDVKLDEPEDHQEVEAEEGPEESDKTPDEPEIEPLLDIIEDTEAELQMELDPSLPPIKIQELPTNIEESPKKDEHEVIATDRLIELLDSEDIEVDLSKITLIKAPKKELDGLKVLGKIDLPEPKTINPEKTAQTTEEQKPDRTKRHQNQRQPLSDEEREKRRLKAKEKKEEYEARQEKRRKAEEKNRLKAQKKARYEQKMHQIKASQPKRKIEKQDIPAEVIDIAPKSKTILGKFWSWLKA